LEYILIIYLRVLKPFAEALSELGRHWRVSARDNEVTTRAFRHVI
jgi:hypothetical protein